MRITVDLDDDVVALLAHLRVKRGASMKEVANTALRIGLVGMSNPAEAPNPFQRATLSNGPCRLASIDNIEDAVAWAEGEDCK